MLCPIIRFTGKKQSYGCEKRNLIKKVATKMKRIKIAVLFGGCSSEYEVSLQSAYSVLKGLDKDRYELVPVGISENGDWYCYEGEFENIKNNQWL